MVAPEVRGLPEELPQPSCHEKIFLIHVHEDGIVVPAEPPREPQEAERV
jgi:hypothetical protein